MNVFVHAWTVVVTGVRFVKIFDFFLLIILARSPVGKFWRGSMVW